MTTTQTEFPVITLYQPWATWIMREWKTIETRTHSKFRNLKGKTILIHAGLGVDEKAANCPYLAVGQIKYKPEEMIAGHILGSAFVFDFRELYSQAHSKMALIDCENTKRWGLFLSRVKKFDKPLKVSGERGIWYYDIVKEMKVKKRKFDPNEIVFPE